LAVGLVLAFTWGCEDKSSVPATTATTSSALTWEAIDAALNAAEEYRQGGELGKAEAILQQLLVKAPQEPRAQVALGENLLMQAAEARAKGNEVTAIVMVREAWTHYRAAVKLESNSAGLRHSAAMAALKAGDEAGAIEQLQAAVKLDATNPQYPLHLAQLLIKATRYDEAAAQVEAVLALTPREPLAIATAAALAMERGDGEEAVRQIEDARAIDPGSLALRVQESKIRRRTGQPRRAIELLISLSESDRGQEAVAFEIATAYGMIGEHQRAALTWELCARANPRSVLAATKAGESWLAAGESEQAAHWAEIVREFETPTRRHADTPK
jgi:tetratricopeptide (TPR) repeat protein